jgi:hypothetical protein
VGAVVLFVIGLHAWKAHERAIGAAEAELRAAKQKIAALEVLKRGVDTVYAADTTALHAANARFFALRAAWLKETAGNFNRPPVAPTDTATPVAPVDSLPVTPAAVIAAADTAIRACQAVVVTCEQRVAIRDSIIAAQNQAIRAIVARQPSWFSRQLSGAARIAVGVGIGLLVKR